MITEAIALLILPVSATYVLYNVYSRTFKLFQNMQISTADNAVEIKDPISLRLVSGAIPEWLNGVMYRVGSGIFQIPQIDGSTFVIRHAFDGLPVAHRFEISGDKQSVMYNSRSLSDGVIDNIKNKRTNGMIFFGHVLDVSFVSWFFNLLTRFYVTMIAKKPMSTKPDSQRVGVTITPNFPLPEEQQSSKKEVLVTKTDVNILQKIDPTTLEPESIFTYSKYNPSLKGRFSAAHHQVDLQTGEIFNFVGNFEPDATIRVFSATPSGETTVLATITHRLDKERTPIQIPYIHSFWLTKNYVIIPEFPLHYKNKSINTLIHGTALSAMVWENRPAYLHVVRRKLDSSHQDGLVASIPVPGFYEFHTANAFESIDENGNTILNLDCCAFNDGNIIYQVHSLYTSPEKYISKPTIKEKSHAGIRVPELKHMDFGDLRRYSLNLTSKSVKDISTLARNVEFPRFNQDLLFQDYNFIYATQIVYKPGTSHVDRIALIKVNLKTNITTVFEKEEYSFSEPVFVQRSKHSEDDGVLLSLGNTTGCCYLFVLDAVSMKELACFAIGEFTASTFHGSYVDYDFTPINVN